MLEAVGAGSVPPQRAHKHMNTDTAEALVEGVSGGCATQRVWHEVVNRLDFSDAVVNRLLDFRRGARVARTVLTCGVEKMRWRQVVERCAASAFNT